MDPTNTTGEEAALEEKTEVPGVEEDADEPVENDDIERVGVIRRLMDIINRSNEYVPIDVEADDDGGGDDPPRLDAAEGFPYEGRDLNQEKGCFILYVQDQIQKIKIRMNILRFKYSGYKFWFDSFNIGILLMSAVLTLMEAIRARLSIDTDEMDSVEAISMGITPIVVSSVVTVCSALVKFKKYQVKMENLQRAIQKAIFTLFRLKRVQENAKHLQTFEELESLIQLYSDEPYNMYVECQEEMEKNLQYDDLVKHMKTYYALSLEYERSENDYLLSRLLMKATQQIREKNVDQDAGALIRNAKLPRCPPSSMWCCASTDSPDGEEESKVELA